MSSDEGCYSIIRSEHGIFYECGEQTAAYNISNLITHDGSDGGRMLTAQA